MPASRFSYEDAIVVRFPTLVGGAIHATGVANGSTARPLAEAFEAEQSVVRIRIGEAPLSELPSLAAWRRAFRTFGVDPTGYRSAAEALLRRLTKQGKIPSISTLVDIGNLVSIRYALPVAVFDLRAVSGGITVRFATGEESFTDLGSGAPESPEPGEVVFLDGDGLVHARRWCWRQSVQSASRPETTEVLVTVEGHHASAAADVSAAIRDLEALLAEHVGSSASASAILGPSQPAFAGLGG